MGVASHHHLCHILVMRGKSQVLPTLENRESFNSLSTGRQLSWGSYWSLQDTVTYIPSKTVMGISWEIIYDIIVGYKIINRLWTKVGKKTRIISLKGETLNNQCYWCRVPEEVVDWLRNMWTACYKLNNLCSSQMRMLKS